MLRLWSFCIFILGVLLLLNACGDSGANGLDDGPVESAVDLDPNAIDSGDRAEVEVQLENISVDRFAIKVRLPSAYRYVPDTSFFIIGDRILDTGPTNNESDGSNVYLVYYTTAATFRPEGRGSLIFVVQGISDLPSGKVEVDIDFDEPTVSNSTEFSISNPRFDAQSDTDVRVGPPPPSSSSGSTTTSSSSSASSSASSSSSSSS